MTADATNQPGLFDGQHAHLARVSSRIAAAILEFCRENRQFYADQLRRHVAEAVGPTAPGSADRILRDLRQRGLVDYVVLNRRESLYAMREAK